jgi:hypothetical protein
VIAKHTSYFLASCTKHIFQFIVAFVEVNLIVQNFGDLLPDGEAVCQINYHLEYLRNFSLTSTISLYSVLHIFLFFLDRTWGYVEFCKDFLK